MHATYFQNASRIRTCICISVSALSEASTTDASYDATTRNDATSYAGDAA
jgi:hypothetical protein